MKYARHLSCIAALATLCAMQAAAQDSSAQERKQNPPPLGTASFTPPESKQREPLTPENFVVRAAIANMSEVELSELALEKSADASLRKYASQLIQDHKAAQAKLKAAAGAVKIALPGTVDEDHRKQKQSLAERVGADFDREYVALMQSGHDQAIALLSSATKSQELDPSLKKYANEALPTVQHHRKQLDALRTQKAH